MAKDHPQKEERSTDARDDDRVPFNTRAAGDVSGSGTSNPTPGADASRSVHIDRPGIRNDGTGSGARGWPPSRSGGGDSDVAPSTEAGVPIPPTVTSAPFERGPRRQLRRVGTKIGRKVLAFERLVLRLGPLHVYRTARGGFAARWVSRRR